MVSSSLTQKMLKSRTQFTLLPTTKSTATGVPLAARLNLGAHFAKAHEEDHGEPLGHKLRHDTRLPSFSTSNTVKPIIGLFNKSPLNAGVTIPGRRLLSTSATKAAGSATSMNPKYEPKSLMEDNDRYSPAVPDYSKYTSKRSEQSGRNFSYFVIGSMGLLTAAGTKSVVSDFIANLSASADVLALAKVEVDLASIPEGKNAIIKWRGKPVFVRHRTPDDIKDAESVDIKALRDPQSDKERVKKPEWLVMLGVCTHLGCVPIGEAGDYNGWFCPCHGSHYDSSGRIRKGPAPLNLEVPEYDFDGETMIIG